MEEGEGKKNPQKSEQEGGRIVQAEQGTSRREQCTIACLERGDEQ